MFRYDSLGFFLVSVDMFYNTLSVCLYYIYTYSMARALAPCYVVKKNVCYFFQLSSLVFHHPISPKFLGNMPSLTNRKVFLH